MERRKHYFKFAITEERMQVQLKILQNRLHMITMRNFAMSRAVQYLKENGKRPI